jgi:hypothetical protein
MIQFEPAGPSKHADLSDIALVWLVSSVGRRSDVGAEDMRYPTARRVYRPNHKTWREELVALRIRLVIREPRPTNLSLCGFA